MLHILLSYNFNQYYILYISIILQYYIYNILIINNKINDKIIVYNILSFYNYKLFLYGILVYILLFLL